MEISPISRGRERPGKVRGRTIGKDLEINREEREESRRAEEALMALAASEDDDVSISLAEFEEEEGRT
ncbi:hypothetical protein Lal_00038577 [Lupinus albus]|nr:hypothetical protein Lal_00038577 [Lupinus albus]